LIVKESMSDPTTNTPADVSSISSQVASIVNQEQSNINGLMSTVNSTVESKTRLLELNESYRLRTAEYMYIMLILIFGIAACVLTVLVSDSIPFIPSVFFDFCIVIIVCFCGITIFYEIFLIMNRDNMNFNELSLPPPVTQNTTISQAKASSANGDLLGTLGLRGCIGQSCCGPDTVWDGTRGICVLPSQLSKVDNVPVTTTYAPFVPTSSVSVPIVTVAPTTPSVTIQNSFITMQEDFSVQANSPNEYASYAKL